MQVRTHQSIYLPTSAHLYTTPSLQHALLIDDDDDDNDEEESPLIETTTLIPSSSSIIPPSSLSSSSAANHKKNGQRESVVKKGLFSPKQGHDRAGECTTQLTRTHTRTLTRAHHNTHVGVIDKLFIVPNTSLPKQSKSSLLTSTNTSSSGKGPSVNIEALARLGRPYTHIMLRLTI
jgi:hypothetical protein